MHGTFYKLMNQLSKPSKVASSLDWKKMSGSTLLSLNIHQDRIGIAVASHPSLGDSCAELEPLRFADDHITIDKACLERFGNIIEDYKVCGIVVGWPLQHETGRMGAACGRVLYALEEIIDKSAGDDTVMSPNRPLCLWDAGHIVPKQRSDPKLAVDAFGRCAVYGKSTDREEEYRASKEQYHEDELTVVKQVWDDFFQVHWPDLYAKLNAKEEEADEILTVPTTLQSRASTRARSYGSKPNHMVQMAR